MDLRFAPIRQLNSVRRELFALFIVFTRTVFFCILYPGRRFGSFLNSALGYDILAFQAGRNTVINLCIESSFQKSSGRNDKRA